MTPRHCIRGVGLVAALVLAAPAGADWQPGGIPVCVAPTNQTTTAAVPDGSGGVIVVWKDQSTRFPYAQRLDGAGNPLWTPNGVAISAGSVFAYDLVAAPDGTGGVFVAWSERRSAPNLDIFAQHVDAQGSVLWAPDLPVCEANRDQLDLAIASDDLGHVFLVWRDGRSSAAPDLYGQALDFTGVALWPPNGLLIAQRTAYQGKPSVVSDGAGGALVVFLDAWGGLTRIVAQRIDPDGTYRWPSFGVPAMNSTFQPRIVSDGLGGAFVTAMAYNSNTATYGMYGQHLDATGKTKWSSALTYIGPAGPSGPSPFLSHGQDAIPDGNGGLIVAWSNHPEGDLACVRRNADGTVVWSNVVARSAADSYIEGPVMMPDDSGGVIVAWQEMRTHDNDVGMMRVDPTGQPMWPDVRPGVPGHRGRPVMVSDGQHGALIAWTDGRIPADYDVYASRVLASGQLADAATSIAITSAAVPAPSALRLDGIWPAPIVHRSSVSFVLPTSAPARLEVVDLAGRLVSTRDVSMGTGRHRLDLEDAGRWAPGMYVVRLIQSGRLATARAIVVR